MTKKINIDATIASDSAKERRIYETQKNVFQQEAEQEWTNSAEAKSLNKTLMTLVKIFGLGVILCFIFVLIIDPGFDADLFGLPLLWTGTFYGLPAIIIYLIVRSKKKRAFVKYYVSKKMLEQINKNN